MSEYLFSGLKVLDVGSWIAGPVATTILADFGADVIKVEVPTGDQYRMLSAAPGTPEADSNYMWQMDARNKRGLSLNLKTQEGIEILHKLVKECDVYVTNQPFPVRRKLGLEYEDIKPLNPGMIFASLTAYGEEGPDRDGEGFDLVAYWARSGLMDLVRDREAKPAMALPGMGDHPTAVSLYASIVTALLHRERTGEGGMVHTSLLANGLWSAACIAQGRFAGGSFTNYREALATAGFARNLYQTKDGRFLQFTMVRTPEQVAKLFEIAGVELEGDARFATPGDRMENGPALVALIEASILQQDAEFWLDQFGSNDVPVNLAALVEEVLDDPQVRINHMIAEPVDPDMDIPAVINHPLKVDSIKQVGPKRAPEIGEHSGEILKELGYDDETISAMRDKGVI